MPNTREYLTHNGLSGMSTAVIDIDSGVLTSVSAVIESASIGGNKVFANIAMGVGQNENGVIEVALASGYVSLQNWVQWTGRISIESPSEIFVRVASSAAVTVKLLITTDKN